MSRSDGLNRVERLAAKLESWANPSAGTRALPTSSPSSPSTMRPQVSVDPSADADLWPTTPLTTIHARGPHPINWVVEKLIERDSGPVLLVGQPAAYKSWISLHIAHSIVTGQPVFGQFAVSATRPVLFLNFDTGNLAFERRLTLLRPASNQFLVSSPETFDFGTLERTMEAHAGAFVCIDCFANIYTPDLRNDQAADMRRFAQGIRRLFEANGCSGIIIDHARRSRPGEGASTDRYYGSVQKAAVFRQMWDLSTVKRQKVDRGSARVKIVCAKMSEAEPFEPIDIALSWAPAFSAAFVIPDDDDAVDRVTQAYDAVVAALDGKERGMSCRELALLTSCKVADVRAATKRPGIKTIGGGRTTKYVLDRDSEPADDEILADS